MAFKENVSSGQWNPVRVRHAFLRRALHLAVGTGLAAMLMLATAGSSSTVSASERPRVIVLPGATSAEGIAAGRGSTFYAGDLFNGDIFRGDLRSGDV